MLRVMSGEAEHFDDADVEVLELMANLMASGLSGTSKLDREAERALRDPLTGLANRFIFMDRLAHHGYEARRYGRPYGSSSAWTASLSSTSRSGRNGATPCCAPLRRA